MLDFLASKEMFVLLTLASKFIWLYFSGKYTITFLVEYTSNRMLGIRGYLPLVLALLWVGFLFMC